MYTEQRGGRRTYACADVRQCTGLCTRPRIPAELIEGHVVSHLDEIVGKNRIALIEERLAMRTDEQVALERTLDERRSELAVLGRAREQRMTELERVGITQVGLEIVERIDAQREDLASVVGDIEARLGEFSASEAASTIVGSPAVRADRTSVPRGARRAPGRPVVGPASAGQPGSASCRRRSRVRRIPRSRASTR